MLIDKFKKLGKIFGSRYLISDNENTYIDGNGDRRHLSASSKRGKIFCIDNKEIYVSNQLKSDNVDKFIDLINNEKNLGIHISELNSTNNN